MNSGDSNMKLRYVAKLETLKHDIQFRATSCKELISQKLEQAGEVQAKLRTMARVQNKESDHLRDMNLMLIHDVYLEDIRLVWLRKEQLQVVELCGRLRTSLPPGTIVPTTLPDVGEGVLHCFRLADSTGTGQIEERRLIPLLQKLSKDLSEERIRFMLKALKGEADRAVNFEELVEFLYPTQSERRFGRQASR